MVKKEMPKKAIKKAGNFSLAKRFNNLKIGLGNFFQGKKLRKFVYLFLSLLVLGFLFYRFRNRFIAGMVNGEPIFRFQLSQRLNSQYGRTVLEDLIVEKLIYQEAKTGKISLSPEEFSLAIEKLEKQLGEGTKIESVLALQGIDKATFEQQLRLQLLVRKIMESRISISETEITDYIKENRAQMEATSEADLSSEAKNSLLDEKISAEINPWISTLLEKGRISRLVK